MPFDFAPVHRALALSDADPLTAAVLEVKWAEEDAAQAAKERRQLRFCLQAAVLGLLLLL